MAVFASSALLIARDGLGLCGYLKGLSVAAAIAVALRWGCGSVWASDEVATADFIQIGKIEAVGQSYVVIKPIINTIVPAGAPIRIERSLLGKFTAKAGEEVLLTRTGRTPDDISYGIIPLTREIKMWFDNAPPSYWSEDSGFKGDLELRHIAYYFDAMSTSDSDLRGIAEVLLGSMRIDSLAAKELHLDVAKMSKIVTDEQTSCRTRALIAVALARSRDPASIDAVSRGFAIASASDANCEAAAVGWGVALILAKREEGVTALLKSPWLSGGGGTGGFRIVLISRFLRRIGDHESRGSILPLLTFMRRNGEPNGPMMDELREWNIYGPIVDLNIQPDSSSTKKDWWPEYVRWVVKANMDKDKLGDLRPAIDKQVQAIRDVDAAQFNRAEEYLKSNEAAPPR